MESIPLFCTRYYTNIRVCKLDYCCYYTFFGFGFTSYLLTWFIFVESNIVYYNKSDTDDLVAQCYRTNAKILSGHELHSFSEEMLNWSYPFTIDTLCDEPILLKKYKFTTHLILINMNNPRSVVQQQFLNYS